MKTLTLVRHAKSSWKDSSLADRDRPLNKRGEHDAPLMVDDTIATAANVHAFQFADVVTTSLTKIFSGVGDVMAGAVTLRADSPFHDLFHELLTMEVEDAPLFSPDAVVLEENSRDFADRVRRINATAAILCGVRRHRAGLPGGPRCYGGQCLPPHLREYPWGLPSSARDFRGSTGGPRPVSGAWPRC